MRILLFGWEYPPFNSGGLGTACEGLARALVAQGEEVIFVLPRKVAVSEPGVKFIFLDLPEPSAGMGAYLSESQFGKLYGGSLAEQVRLYALKAREIAATEQFDIIHAHDWLTFGAGLAAKELSGKPLVAHVHATEFDRTGNGEVNQAVYDLERRGMHQADMVVTVSGFTKNIVTEKYGVDPAKVMVVHNGIEAEAVPEKPGTEIKESLTVFKKQGKKIVLFLGRLTLQKGPDYFLQAAAKVVKLYPKALFVIAGSGDMENQIVRQAADLGIADKVLFAGFVRGPELTALYRAADLYVMPSVSEPFGITPLESLVQGTPVLISKQSGVSEVVKHALKADFWDIDEIADKIISVLRHDSLRDVLKLNGQQEVKGITWKKAAAKCVAIYKKLINFFKRKSEDDPRV